MVKLIASGADNAEYWTLIGRLPKLAPILLATMLQPLEWRRRTSCAYVKVALSFCSSGRWDAVTWNPV